MLKYQPTNYGHIPLLCVYWKCVLRYYHMLRVYQYVIDQIFSLIP